MDCVIEEIAQKFGLVVLLRKILNDPESNETKEQSIVSSNFKDFYKHVDNEVGKEVDQDNQKLNVNHQYSKSKSESCIIIIRLSNIDVTNRGSSMEALLGSMYLLYNSYILLKLLESLFILKYIESEKVYEMDKDDGLDLTTIKEKVDNNEINEFDSDRYKVKERILKEIIDHEWDDKIDFSGCHVQEIRAHNVHHMTCSLFETSCRLFETLEKSKQSSPTCFGPATKHAVYA